MPNDLFTLRNRTDAAILLLKVYRDATFSVFHSCGAQIGSKIMASDIHGQHEVLSAFQAFLRIEPADRHVVLLQVCGCSEHRWRGHGCSRLLPWITLQKRKALAAAAAILVFIKAEIVRGGYWWTENKAGRLLPKVMHFERCATLVG